MTATIFIAQTSTDRVSCASYFDAKCSAEHVREEYFHLTGEWCTEAQALAACYSVPDGAPATMAAINVGPASLDDVQAAHYESMRRGIRAVSAYMIRR